MRGNRLVIILPLLALAFALCGCAEKTNKDAVEPIVQESVEFEAFLPDDPASVTTDFGQMVTENTAATDPAQATTENGSATDATQGTMPSYGIELPEDNWN